MGGNKGTYVILTSYLFGKHVKCIFTTHIYFVFTYMGGNKGTYITINY